MRKLNPMNRPRTPPLSATRSSIEKAFCSLTTWIVEVVKNAFTSVKFQVFGLCIGSSITCVIRHVYYHNTRVAGPYGPLTLAPAGSYWASPNLLIKVFPSVTKVFCSVTKGLSFGHQGLPFSHQGLSFRHQGLPSGTQSLSFHHQGLPFSHQGLPFGYQGLPLVTNNYQ